MGASARTHWLLQNMFFWRSQEMQPELAIAFIHHPLLFQTYPGPEEHAQNSQLKIKLQSVALKIPFLKIQVNYTANPKSNVLLGTDILKGHSE